MKRWLTAWSVLALIPAVLAADINEKDRLRLDAQLTELSDLVGRETLGAMDWTRGTFVATRFFAYGPAGVPYLFSRFSDTGDVNKAMLSGLFVATHGNDRDRFRMRIDMEQSATKQQWLQAALGSRPAMRASIEQGMPWRPLSKCLPSTRGPVRLALLCLQSEDILVRRLGLFWGFWMPSDQYWGAVRTIQQADPDSSTRAFARFLLEQDA